MGNQESKPEEVDVVESPLADKEAENEEVPLQNAEEIKAEVNSMGVRRKAIQDAFSEGGNLMDVKERAMQIMADYGIENWGKDEDSFLGKIIRGYRTKTVEIQLPNENADKPAEKVEEKAEEVVGGAILPGEQMQTCIVMFDEYPRTQGIMCANGHFISRSALNHYVKTENGKEFEEVYAREGKILCPKVILKECDSKPYGDVEIARMVDVDVFEKYMEQTKRCLYQQAFEEISEKMKKLQKKSDMYETYLMEEQVRLQFKREDGTFGGYMCPECRFGPIDHQHCEDLRAHHQQQSGGAIINNACPICGFFNSKLENWLQWDGTFLRLDEEGLAKLQERLKINREEKKQLDDLITKMNRKAHNYVIRWNGLRRQLVARVNELSSRRQWLLTYVSRITARAEHAKYNKIDGGKKQVDEVEKQVEIITAFVKNLDAQLDQIKSGELWKVADFTNNFSTKMSGFRDEVLNTQDEAQRRAKFPEMMDNIRGLETEIARGISCLKIIEVTEEMEKISGERLRTHQKAGVILDKLRYMIDKEAQGLVDIIKELDPYSNFMKGFNDEEESDAASPETPDTPDLEEEHNLDEFGEIIQPEIDLKLLRRPTMSVQESREKSFLKRENIEKYEEKYDEIQAMYLNFILEDGKMEEEESSTFAENFDRLVSNIDEMGKLPEDFSFDDCVSFLAKRHNEETNRSGARLRLLMDLRTELEIEILQTSHPEMDSCQSVIVVRKFIGPNMAAVNGTYVLQDDLDLETNKSIYKNDMDTVIKWTQSYNYNQQGQPVADPNINGAWIIQDTVGRIMAALPNDVPNPTGDVGAWVSMSGHGAVRVNNMIKVEFGLVYLQKEKNAEEVIEAADEKDVAEVKG